MQLKFFQVQTSYQVIKIQMAFHSNTKDTQNIHQIKIYYTQLDTGIERTRKLI